jgi:transcriptional antiterminator NusG
MSDEMAMSDDDTDDIDEMAWYVVHTYSGYENKAKLALEERIRSLGLEDIFGEILVPEEQVVERTKTGKTRNVSRRFFPGYMLVQMAMDNRAYHVVRNTPKVTGFVGGSNTRTPPRVPEHEVRRILGQIEKGTTTPKPKLSFDRGEAVRVIEGPFANFNGTVDEVRPEKGKLRVMVSIFGRPTPVELDFMQVQKT